MHIYATSFVSPRRLFFNVYCTQSHAIHVVRPSQELLQTSIKYPADYNPCQSKAVIHQWELPFFHTGKKKLTCSFSWISFCTNIWWTVYLCKDTHVCLYIKWFSQGCFALKMHPRTASEKSWPCGNRQASLSLLSTVHQLGFLTVQKHFLL